MSQHDKVCPADCTCKSCASVESFLKRFIPGVCPVCDRAIVSHTTQALEDCVKRKREGQTLSAEREKRDRLMRELAGEAVRR